MGMNSVFKGLILTIAGHITSYLSLIVFSSIISHENNFRTGNNYDINVDNNGYILICKYFILILEMVLFSQKMTRLQA